MDSTPPARRARILIVEDEPLVAGVLADALTIGGFDVEMAANGRVALEKLRTTADYDLVLSDLLMPELDGVGLYQELERLHPSLVRRILFISGTTQVSAYTRFLAETGAPLLRKPFGMEALLRAVTDFLGRPAGPGAAG
jgi:DNA-binding response OmpR family regulator